MNHFPDASRLFSAIIRGDLSVLDHQIGLITTDQLLTAAAYHGIGPLLGHALLGETEKNGAADDLLARLRPQNHAEAALELLRERELRKVLNAFAEARIRSLLIKGTPLAHTHYSSPSLRPRGDTDMLIREQDREKVRALLTDLGYQWDNATSGRFISHQFTAEMTDDLRVDHALDIHWKLSNQQLFANIFTYDELAEESVPVQGLDSRARTLSPVHALILACTHRVSHIHAPYYLGTTPHYGGDRLIWLYDIHVLVARMPPRETESLAGLAAIKKVRTVCLDGLLRARDYFGTALPDNLIASLQAFSEPEPSARYLETGRLKLLMNEMRALPGWRARAALLKEHAFPPADYVLRKYHVSSRAWLPALYVHRGLSGAWKLMRQP